MTDKCDDCGQPSVCCDKGTSEGSALCNVLALKLARSDLATLRLEVEAWEELVAASAPLTWAYTNDIAAAHEWEKRAADMLTKRAKLLSLGLVPAAKDERHE